MKKFLKTALAILPIAMLASCSDDVLPDNNGEIAEKTETRYLQVTLSSADGTPYSRAIGDLQAEVGQYESGTEDENKIKTLDFYFYDRYKNFHSHVSMNLTDADSDGSGDIDPDPITDPNRPNLSGFYHCNVPVELVQGETLPTYVICIINAVQSAAYRDKPMEEAQKTVLTSLYAGIASDTKYFGMSNSVYYGRDEVTGNNNELIMATPFDTNKLKSATELKAMDEEALEANTINIYVERYAVKVNLDLKDTQVPDYKTKTINGNGVTLKFTAQGWNPNSVESKFFFLKAFRTIAATTMTGNDGETTGGYGVDFEKFENLSFLFTGWNNENHHRCYWARTPGYYENIYPIVADDVDNQGGTTKGQYSVQYNSYNQCIAENPIKSLGSFSAYTMESTMKRQRLTNEDGSMGSQYLPTAAIPAVLMVGQYTVNGEAVDFYTYNKYTETVDGKKVEKSYIYCGESNDITGARNIKDKMIDDQSILMYLDEEQNRYLSLSSAYATENGLRELFEVEHPSLQVRMTSASAVTGEAENGGLKIAGDIVCLQIKQPTEKLIFYNAANKDNGNNGFEAVTTDNINYVNRLLYQNLGGAHMYKNGYAFFTAPIYHWGWYRKEIKDASGKITQEKNPNYGKPANEWDWSKMRTGDFGLVRNHIYTVKIGKIEGLGNGIKDPNDPLLPSADKVGYEVHFHVNIQKWAVLPTQNWDW